MTTLGDFVAKQFKAQLYVRALLYQPIESMAPEVCPRGFTLFLCILSLE